MKLHLPSDGDEQKTGREPLPNVGPLRRLVGTDGRLYGYLNPANVKGVIGAPSGIGAVVLVEGAALEVKGTPEDVAVQLFGGRDG